MISIALSIYLWNYPLPDNQFWTLNIIDLMFVVTALAIPVRKGMGMFGSQVERLGHAHGRHGLRSHPGHS